MLTRHHAFRIGCALLVLTGICWFAMTQCAPEVGVSIGSLARPLPTTEPVQPAESAIAASPAETQFHVIRELLDQQRQLGPADREREDDIRRTLLSQLTDTNAAIIVQSLSSEDLNSEFGLAALSRWAANDPLAATLWLAEQPAKPAEQTWVIAQAIVRDPNLLSVLCDQLPATAWREELVAAASRAALPENPGEAIALAQQLQPGPAQVQALLAVADEWTLRDPTAAARWIASEPDLQLRDGLILAGASARASVDPVGALAWTFDISSPDTFDRSLGKITAMWADYEPERAKHFATLVEPQPISPAP